MSAQPKARPDPVSDGTRTALIKAAMAHFADVGFDSAPLRAIVADAGQNISSVKYHFGSKQGLYDACVRAGADRISRDGPGVTLDRLYNDLDAMTPDQAGSAIRELVQTVIDDAQRPEARDETRFMLREVVLGGRGVEVFLEHVLSHHIDRLAALVAKAEGLTPGSRAARLRALAIMGQTIFFLVAQTLVGKAMNWDEINWHIADLTGAIYPANRNLKGL